MTNIDNILSIRDGVAGRCGQNLSDDNGGTLWGVPWQYKAF